MERGHLEATSSGESSLQVTRCAVYGLDQYCLCVQAHASLLHDGDIEEMWGHLRAVVVFHLRPFNLPQDVEGAGSGGEDTDDLQEGGAGTGEDPAAAPGTAPCPPSPVSDGDTTVPSASSSTTCSSVGVGPVGSAADRSVSSGDGSIGHGEGVAGAEEADPLKRAYALECRRHQKLLFRYAMLAQHYFGHLLCKSNLHASVCALPVQQCVRGHAFYFTEFWLERLMQWAKHSTKFRTTGCPEKLIVGYLLMDMALEKMGMESSSLHTMGGWVDMVRGVARADTYRGSNLDPGTADGAGCLGSGVLLEEEGGRLRGECQASLLGYLTEFPGGSWREEDIAGCKMVVYNRAQLAGGEVIHSASYGKATSRVSHYIAVKYRYPARGGRGIKEVQYVGVVQRFLMAIPRTAGRDDESRAHRFALADLYEADVVSSPVGEIMYAKCMCGAVSTPVYKAYPVSLGLIEGKLVKCMKGDFTGKPAATKVAFVPYSHVPSPLE